MIPRSLYWTSLRQGLDPNERIRFRNLISELSQERLVLLSTHIVSDVEYIANEIWLMKDGAFVCQGTARSLITAMPENVWHCFADKAMVPMLMKKYKISNIKSDPDRHCPSDHFQRKAVSRCTKGPGVFGGCVFILCGGEYRRAEMVIYELKKVLFKNSSKAALIFLGAVLIFVIHMAVSGIRYVDDEGITHTGIWAAQQLREVKAPWEGPLTAQRLAQVIETNQKENATPEALSEDISQQNISYSRKQGYSDILTLMSDIFGSFDTFDYFVSDGLTVEDADDFYTQRVERLRQWLDGPAGDKYTQKEKEYFIRQFEAVKEPLYYEAADGWDQLFYLFPSLISVAAPCHGIFSVRNFFTAKKQWKTDTIFFSSFQGRRLGPGKQAGCRNASDYRHLYRSYGPVYGSSAGACWRRRGRER